MPPPLIPPRGGEEDKRHIAVPLSQIKEPVFSEFILPGIFCLGAVTWDFWLDLGDTKALLYKYGN